MPKLGPLFFAVSWFAALFMVNGYDVQIPASRVLSLVVVCKAIPIVSVFGFLAFFAHPYGMTRPVIVLSVLIGAVLIVTERCTIARVLIHEAFASRTVLVTTGGHLSEALRNALHSARYAYRVVAAVNVENERAGLRPDSHLSAQLSLVLHERDAQEVIVADDDLSATHEAVEACFSQGIRVVLARDLIERFEGRVPLDLVDESWFLRLPAHSLLNRPYLAVRRVADVALSVAAGLPFLLLLPLIAALIKLDSPGPVFFWQLRVGRFGRRFSIPKLRSMRTDAELGGFRWAQRDDPRVTRIGRILRLTRLDEFPQVLSVLKGEMSFIGPRPERPEFVAQLEQQIPHYRARLAVKPGISGWAQVKSGYAASIEDTVRKLEYDLYYVKYQSLRLDLQIVLHTLFTVLGLRGR